MAFNIDLHTHSNVSDGSLGIKELICDARSKGVQVLALTDHDSTQGLEYAATVAKQESLNLIPGVEVSVTWKKSTVHIIGLNIDIQHQPLQKGLSVLREFRQWRAEEMARKLEKSGIHDALTGAKSFAEGDLLTRTHFARLIVSRGMAKDTRQVFKRYLKMNKPGYVPGQWADLENAIAWITGASGQAVIAHPARYNMSSSKLSELICQFKEMGGVGIEVVSGSHSKQDSLAMAKMAETHKLLASAGSDYHGPENPWIDLGKLPSLPENCTPIWDNWASPDTENN